MKEEKEGKERREERRIEQHAHGGTREREGEGRAGARRKRRRADEGGKTNKRREDDESSFSLLYTEPAALVGRWSPGDAENQ